MKIEDAVELPAGWKEDRGEWTDGCLRHWRDAEGGFAVCEYPDGFKPIHLGRFITRDPKGTLTDALDTCAEYARGTIESYVPMAAWNRRANPAAGVAGAVNEIAREAAKVQTSGTGRMGAPHKETCTCRQCTDRELAQVSAMAKAAASIDLEALRQHLETMLASAEVYVDDTDTVTGYKVKTGALHRIIGFFASKGGKALTIPTQLPIVYTDPRPASVEGEALGWHLQTSVDRLNDYFDTDPTNSRITHANDWRAVRAALSPQGDGWQVDEAMVSRFIEAFHKAANDDACHTYAENVRRALQAALAPPSGAGGS